MIEKYKEQYYEICPDLKWPDERCDKYDVIASVFCGAIAGVIDILFVGSLGEIKGMDLRTGKLQRISDVGADNLIKKCAKLMGWKPSSGKASNVASAIGFLEKNYVVNYDQKNSTEVNGLFRMTPSNHHFKSLSHAPDIVGLFFSILDQFMNTSSFLADGKLIRIDTSEGGCRLEGRDFCSKLYCGFCNWLGHLLSDMCGSSGNRGRNSGSRGKGIAVPFMELFQLCDFGKFQIGKDKQTLAILMTRAYESGYDFRSGAAATIPVFIEEMMVRAFWSIKRHYYKRYPFEKCVPDKSYGDLRIMLLISNGTLCVLDAAGAAASAGTAGGNALVFVLHLNIPAWLRLIVLVFRELTIRFGPEVDRVLRLILDNILLIETPCERRNIENYYHRIREQEQQSELAVQMFGKEIFEVQKSFIKKLEQVNNSEVSMEAQINASIFLAREYGVDESRIMKGKNDMDALFRRHKY